MNLNRADPGFGKLVRAARSVQGHFPPHLPPVLVFTDPDRSPPALDLAPAIPRNWALVYRHFGAAGRKEIALKLSQMAKRNGFQLLIGADPDLARSVRADGVHWPERLEREARRYAQHFKLNTMSAHGPPRLRRPSATPISALVLSTVFPSESPSASVPLGVRRFRTLSRSTDVPVYGLGGVNGDTGRQISTVAGLAGVGRL